MKIPYALSIALITSVVDALPVFGVGTVLLPWSAVCFALGDGKTAIGMLILYIVITAVRQIAEPKILGRKMGMSPLITLISMYTGYRFFGFWGLILTPFLLSVVYSVLNEAYRLSKTNCG